MTAPRHRGPLGSLDAMVDAVERWNLDVDDPRAPLTPSLTRLADRVGAKLEQPSAVTGGALHGALLDLAERYMPAGEEVDDAP